jgi:DNA repair exonuclease SbcCD ATPase subunit
MTQANQDVSEPATKSQVRTVRARFQKLMAGVLCLLSLGFISAAVMLPGPTAINEKVDKLVDVASAAEEQIKTMETSLQIVSNSATQGNLKHLVEYAEVLKPALENRNIDFEHLKATSNVIGNMADGLRTFGETLEPEHIDSLASGIGSVAGYLEQIEPLSEKLADGLDEQAEVLRKQAIAFAKILDELPLDQRGIEMIEKALASASKASGDVAKKLTPTLIPTIQTTIKNMGAAVTTLRDGLNIGNWFPKVKQWQRDLDRVWKDLDRIHDAVGNEKPTLVNIRRSASDFSKMLELLRKSVGSVKPLLTSFPEIIQKSSERLPALANNLSRILRNLEDFQKMALFLRQAEKQLTESTTLFTATQQNIKDTVVILEGLKTRLDSAYANREAIEENYTKMIALTKNTVDGIPVMIENVEFTMDTGITNLTNLRVNISATREALPDFSSVAGFWMVTFRIGLALIGLVFAGQSFWGFKDVGISQ